HERQLSRARLAPLFADRKEIDPNHQSSILRRARPIPTPRDGPLSLRTPPSSFDPAWPRASGFTRSTARFVFCWNAASRPDTRAPPPDRYTLLMRLAGG